MGVQVNKLHMLINGCLIVIYDHCFVPMTQPHHFLSIVSQIFCLNTLISTSITALDQPVFSRDLLPLELWFRDCGWCGGLKVACIYSNKKFFLFAVISWCMKLWIDYSTKINCFFRLYGVHLNGSNGRSFSIYLLVLIWSNVHYSHMLFQWFKLSFIYSF